ncbi:probable inactive purple acid phosphatase 28 isoform X1 [Diospyros lotus]|uniref:probable inactive purple acid phosphatase 28 isoform X1 n=1 Tax=Diospyros lotus TaxID=55363 RepID=UPI002257DDE2|nr:probable inactive purple acid phosphatase 28 isoform X1 [Diospyros lotus]XP_052183869.1 probable inactive purple acid phosphatase 28 isoform X1 [Diospyros lotus]
MESASDTTWIHLHIHIQSLLYLAFITSSIYLIHALISEKLILNHHSVTAKKHPPLPLRFRAEDGTFKILQVADLHYGNGVLSRCRDVSASEFDKCSDLNSIRFMRRIIQAENPDFVAFTGDNIFGTSSPDAAESLFGAFGPAMESGLPWAAILGNHDQESTMTREELMSFISLMDYSVAQINPLAENTSDPAEKMLLSGIDGFGNYNLRICGAPGSHLANHTVLNLYFLDSGDRAIVEGVRTYGWIKESQLRWLRNVSKNFQGQNLDNSRLIDAFSHPAIALAFFHIPIPEVRQVKEIVGHYQEYVACSSVNSGVLQTLASMGDVKAVFIGHDHNNDFCGNLDGIWFCYGGGFGYHGYGRPGKPRRARIILAELAKGQNSWEGVERIKTWKRLDDETLTKIDEQVLWDRRLSR